jgi:hypothetical protein
VGPDAPAPAHIKERETCPKAGDLHWDTLQNAIRSGWRMTGVHMCGSESLRRMTQMIDQVIAEGHVTLDHVRQQQFSLEHCDMIGKKPEIIDLLKKYNFILSRGPDYIREGWGWLKDYGPTNPNILDALIPFNTWIKSGVNLVGQHYGGGTLGGSEGAATACNRRSSCCGRRSRGSTMARSGSPRSASIACTRSRCGRDGPPITCGSRRSSARSRRGSWRT